MLQVNRKEINSVPKTKVSKLKRERKERKIVRRRELKYTASKHPKPPTDTSGTNLAE